MPERIDLPGTTPVVIPAPARVPRAGSPAWQPPPAGACASEDRGLFVGMPGEPAVARLAREEDAKRVCARCALLLDCRAAALAVPGAAGVRGGLTPGERRAVERRVVRRSRPRAGGR